MKNGIITLGANLIVLAALSLKAQLPPDFPTLSVTTNYAPGVADGDIFQGVNLPVAGIGYYAMIVGNDGVPVWYRELTNACWDFKVLPNGYLHYAQQTRALTYTGGGDVVHEILDENGYPQETIQGGNRYAAEAHEFQMLPNGNVLQIGYYLTQVDMSQVVSNGNPAALVSGAVLQELDAQRNVVFQWRFWDHYPFTGQWVNSAAAVISEFHVNCLFEDTDGNLVVSTPNWVKKISRQTGEILWHLGGVENQFRFVGVSPEEGTNDFAAHDINRLPNGNVLFYSNSQFGQPGSTSTAHEYALDETNKIATLVWSYRPNPGIAGPFQGSAQRLSNDNTFIGWGGLPGVTTVACTEVSGSNVVFQMQFDNTNVVSYRSFRFPYPPSSQATTVSAPEVAAGNSYDFARTGVSIEGQIGGGGYNLLSVTRSPYAPVYPLFQGKAPRVLPVRVSLSASGVDTLGVVVFFDANSLGLSNPTNLTVYYRQLTGNGLFLPQTTSYNPVTGKISVSLSLTSQVEDLGEFIFCYPDLADIPYAPMLNQVVNDTGPPVADVIAPALASAGVSYHVNQDLPVLLSWSPKGLARSYQIQVSTNLDFSTTLVSVAYQNDAYYVFTPETGNTAYFYRVKTVNDGGESDWAVGSFQTAPPFVALTFPQGGETLQRGLQPFIRWNDNIGETVTIELYKGGILAKTISTNAPSTGAYQWPIGSDLTPGNDYTIKISSTTDPTLSAASATPFSIVDVPIIATSSVVRLADGRLQFAVSAPGLSQVSVLTSTKLASWQLLQVLPLSGGTAVFTGLAAPGSPARFYKLQVP